MKKKLFNLVALLSVLALILVMLSGCVNDDDKLKLDEAEKKLNEEMENLDYLSDIQSDVEVILANIQTKFIQETLSDPNAMIYEYITLEKLDEAMKSMNYKLCLENNKNKKPADMSELIINKDEIYFTDGTNILKVGFSISLENKKYTVDSSDIEIVK